MQDIEEDSIGLLEHILYADVFISAILKLELLED
jgi:hypothetical protein